MGKRKRTQNAGERQGDTPSTSSGTETGRWRPVEEAAAFLGLRLRGLREELAKRAQMVNGKTEARFDGILGRKVRGRWIVWLTIEWTAPVSDAPRAMLPAAESAGYGGKESHHGRA